MVEVDLAPDDVQLLRRDPKFAQRLQELAACEENMLMAYDWMEAAPEESKNDREIVMEAVRQNGLALAFASKRLKYDLEIIENLS